MSDLKPVQQPRRDSGDRTDAILLDMFAKMEPYAGNDPNTSPDPYCKACYKREGDDGAHLRVCSRCKAVHYCSVECQRGDFDEHRAECREIACLTAEVASEAASLRAYRFLPSDAPKDLFRDNVGDFWGIVETRNYCRARGRLADALEHVAHFYEVAPLLTTALDHRLDLLRLISSDNMGLRDEVPFTLLRLNRDADCIAFIAHWARRLAGDGGSDDVEALHKNSREGDWLYGRDADVYADILEAAPGTSDHTLDTSMMVAVVIVKMRIIAASMAKEDQVKQLQNTKLGQALNDDAAQSVVRAMTEDAGEIERVKEQRKLVDKYLDIIDKANPTILPAIINPGPLKSKPFPQYVTRGHPSEAFLILQRCNRLFVRVPGAEAMLQRRFGNEKPQYNANTEISH